jgi:membrane protein
MALPAAALWRNAYCCNGLHRGRGVTSNVQLARPLTRPMTGSKGNESRTGSATPRSDGDDRGRSAESPSEIPKQGWRDILLRVGHRISEDNLTLVSAGIAFNAMFAVFPAMVLIVSLYGMFASPGEVAHQMRSLFALLPGDAASLIQTQLQTIASHANSTLSVGAVISLGVTLYSSAQGMSALATATNIAYHEPERRGFLKLLGIAILFTVGGLAGLLLLVGLGVAVPAILRQLPVGAIAKQIGFALNWLLLWLAAVFALAVVYRFAPCRQNPLWRWVTWGSATAATVWLLGSALFAVYVQNFGSYGKTYGALGGVMMLLMWFYLGSFAVLLGAELNAETEHQTAVDTTTGPAEPMGQRGAYVADTLGDTPGRATNQGGKPATSKSLH